MNLEIKNIGLVSDVDVYGSDCTFYQVAGVCTGHGFFRQPDTFKRLDQFIYSLLKNKHLRCFEFAGIIFGIRCPIFVERQLRTYRKPDLERSLRLCEPLELSKANYEYVMSTDDYIRSKEKALGTYQNLVRQGVKREEARRVLPLDTMTDVISLYSIRSLLHVFDERLAKSAQSETTEVVRRMYEITKEFFPETIKAYERVKEESRK